MYLAPEIIERIDNLLLNIKKLVYLDKSSARIENNKNIFSNFGK